MLLSVTATPCVTSNKLFILRDGDVCLDTLEGQVCIEFAQTSEETELYLLDSIGC